MRFFDNFSMKRFFCLFFALLLISTLLVPQKAEFVFVDIGNGKILAQSEATYLGPLSFWGKDASNLIQIVLNGKIPSMRQEDYPGVKAEQVGLGTTSGSHMIYWNIWQIEMFFALIFSAIVTILICNNKKKNPSAGYNAP